MRKLVYSSLLALAVILLTTGLTRGQSGKETRNVSDFNEIGFGISGNLYIKFGSQFSVVLEGDRDYLSEIETDVRNGRLIIRHDNYFRFFDKHADVYITMPSLKALGVSGSGSAVVEDAIKAETLDLDVSGSGKIEVTNVNANELHCGISGSGNIHLNGSGEVQKGDFNISGSGNYRGDDIKVANLEVGISGSGNCSCYVKDNLRASVSGSGNVWFAGNPRLDVRASGSGHVRSR